MRKILVSIIYFLFSFVCFVHASDNYEAIKFSQEYEGEIKENTGRKSNQCSVSTEVRAGIANYEEEEQTIKSDYEAFFPEVLLTAKNQTENDLENEIDLSFGQSTTDTETWYISDVKYQTNDLDFYCLNIKGSIGKILYSDRAPNLQVIPFLGYGFRLINFERTNFNILNIITSREVITEKYYVHHVDFGIKLDKKLNDKFDFFGLGSFAYVFYNQADNNKLGKVEGGGGYLVDGGLKLQYTLSDYCKLIFGGFIQVQDLRGGSTGDIIWPDNKLNIYGGNVGIRLIF